MVQSVLSCLPAYLPLSLPPSSIPRSIASPTPWSLLISSPFSLPPSLPLTPPHSLSFLLPRSPHTILPSSLNPTLLPSISFPLPLCALRPPILIFAFSSTSLSHFDKSMITERANGRSEAPSSERRLTEFTQWPGHSSQSAPTVVSEWFH